MQKRNKKEKCLTTPSICMQRTEAREDLVEMAAAEHAVLAVAAVVHMAAMVGRSSGFRCLNLDCDSHFDLLDGDLVYGSGTGIDRSRDDVAVDRCGRRRGDCGSRGACGFFGSAVGLRCRTAKLRSRAA